MKWRDCRLAFCILVLITVAGCDSGGNEDLKAWMTESSRDLKGGVQPLPELKPFPIVSYDAKGKTDPFSAARIEPERKEGSGANKPDFDRPREQLEAYPLESISFVGLVNKGKQGIRHAMVMVDGMLYQVTKGSYMGQNFGRITTISDSEIVLREIVQDPSGQTADWVERQVTLQLRDGSREKESKR